MGHAGYDSADAPVGDYMERAGGDALSDSNFHMGLGGCCIDFDK
jgi:hypothetical protein